jgi:hypothetical protein
MSSAPGRLRFTLLCHLWAPLALLNLKRAAAVLDKLSNRLARDRPSDLASGKST